MHVGNQWYLRASTSFPEIIYGLSPDRLQDLMELRRAEVVVSCHSVHSVDRKSPVRPPHPKDFSVVANGIKRAKRRDFFPKPNMQSARFEIGSVVKVTGGLAEHYNGVTAEVIAITPHPQGLLHLCRYRVFISGFGEDTFYEFQLALATELAN